MLFTSFIISPPFGNYITAPNCTSIKGSFTWEPRPGLLSQTLKTLRPAPGGWVNQIGLRNRGIRNVRFNDNCIYSLVGLEDGDWERMLEYCPSSLRVEVNLGCPNVHRYGISADLLRAYCRKFLVMVKLPPHASIEMIEFCREAGVSHIHMCNTLPSDRGGISGRQLKPVVQDLLKRVTVHAPGIAPIAGGGIYAPQDVRDYAALGAEHFSLATIWFTPWRVPRVLKAV
jgi:dihydroorotate dehydrogenase